MRKNDVEKDIVKVGKPIDFVRETLFFTHFVKVPINELERRLSPEIVIRGGGEASIREIVEEMKERMRREIERRLRQL